MVSIDSGGPQTTHHLNNLINSLPNGSSTMNVDDSSTAELHLSTSSQSSNSSNESDLLLDLPSSPRSASITNNYNTRVNGPGVHHQSIVHRRQQRRPKLDISAANHYSIAANKKSSQQSVDYSSMVNQMQSSPVNNSERLSPSSQLHKFDRQNLSQKPVIIIAFFFYFFFVSHKNFFVLFYLLCSISLHLAKALDLERFRNFV